MATNIYNISETDFDKNKVSKLKIGIVVAKWNSNITNPLFEGALSTLREYGVSEIYKLEVPGSFELTFGAKKMIEQKKLDAIIVIGCIIRGETPHFDFVAKSVTEGITQLNLKYDTPVIFSVLTTDNLEQAQARAGGKYGNKGSEGAIAAIEMALIKNEMDLMLTKY